MPAGDFTRYRLIWVDEFTGKVTVTRTAQRLPFDWTNVVGKVMRIQWAKYRPKNAAVVAVCRDTHFYIADDDLTSKSTFGLIAQLFSLQAGDINAVVPLLTVSG